ncbi:hypothetical protein [Mycobacteroides salmoniphilum]|uniref:hypothetical protein n=1 Tax=Mycobacteroides salmoniphilum TaxID=404941 RepID=UPI001781B23C|nr:hypothetical protein [Mycobacteroides salmoniphilum]
MSSETPHRINARTCNDQPMIEDRSAAQAHVLLTSLYEHVIEVSQSITEAERRSQNAPIRPTAARHRRRHLIALRKDLYEAHRLIDELRRKFPSARDIPWPTTNPPEVPRPVGVTRFVLP